MILNKPASQVCAIFSNSLVLSVRLCLMLLLTESLNRYNAIANEWNVLAKTSVYESYAGLTVVNTSRKAVVLGHSLI